MWKFQFIPPTHPGLTQRLFSARECELSSEGTLEFEEKKHGNSASYNYRISRYAKSPKRSGDTELLTASGHRHDFVLDVEISDLLERHPRATPEIDQVHGVEFESDFQRAPG